jgi:hypothetical protein
MRGFDRLRQESVKPQGFLAPIVGLAALSQAPCAQDPALCKTANREMRSRMQIAKRFANQSKATKQSNRSTLMNVKNKLAALAFVALSATAASSAAQAQSNSWYVSPSQTPTYEGLTSLNSAISSAPTFTNLPISFSIGSTSGQISFTGSSVTAAGGAIHNADGSKYTGTYLAAASGSAIIDFDTQQKFFSMRWGSVDATNTLAFYNGNDLLQSITGTQAMAARTAFTSVGSYDAGFSFGEVGFTRVVATGSGSGAFEFGNIAVSDVAAPEVAPIPLNAASLGGLMSFLMMLGMRGKGGTQVALRMAFASLIPRRRGMA